MRAVEREVKDAEAQVRKKFPEALYIELEPDSRKTSSSALDDGREASLRKLEIETIKQLQSTFRKERLEEISRMGPSAWLHASSDELAVEAVVEDNSKNDVLVSQDPFSTESQGSLRSSSDDFLDPLEPFNNKRL